MKKIILIAALAFVNAGIYAQSTAETLSGFVKDIPALSSENIVTIQGLGEAAQKKATKTIDLTKDNAADAFKEAQNYKTCIVVVENHTIVKFSDIKKCTQSGSWGVCMPYGEGYIQRGGLAPMNDYINNIIGRPDTQKRTLYLF